MRFVLCGTGHCIRLKHCYILLSGLIVFARCGSTPSVDPAADAEGDIPISDVADVETGIDGGMDASELFDHGDGYPTDVEDDLNDVEDGSVRPDIADVGTPEVTNCGDLGVICFVDDQAATSPIEVVFDPAGTEWPLCRLMGATSTDTVAWDLHFADGAVASLQEMPGM